MRNIIVKQTVDIDVEEVFKEAMIYYSCEMFALLVAQTVMKHDEPDRLKKCIEHELKVMKTTF